MPATISDSLAAPEFDLTEARELFDATAHRYFKISGAEFLKRWDDGAYTAPAVKARAMRVAILIPMVRKTSARSKSR